MLIRQSNLLVFCNRPANQLSWQLKETVAFLGKSMVSRGRRAPTLSPSIHPFLLYLVSFALLAPHYLLFARASSSTSEVVTPVRRETSTMTTDETADIRIIFSDVDGTLVHYPEGASNNEKEQVGNRILKLPPSATGMQGIISSRSLEYCRDLRRQHKKLVLISGMRTTTLLKRLPYLPRADAYCMYDDHVFQNDTLLLYRICVSLYLVARHRFRSWRTNLLSIPTIIRNGQHLYSSSL